MGRKYTQKRDIYRMVTYIEKKYTRRQNTRRGC